MKRECIAVTGDSLFKEIEIGYEEEHEQFELTEECVNKAGQKDWTRVVKDFKCQIEEFVFDIRGNK